MYLISSEWVNEWLKFTQNNDKFKESPPGPVSNESLEKDLVFDENFDKVKKNMDYYFLTKEVWEFFFNIYGGGPALMMNNVEDRLNATQLSEAGSNKFEIQSVTSSNFSNNKSRTQTANTQNESNYNSP